VPRTLVFQPPGSHFCGAACLATVAGTDLEGAHQAIGGRGLTNARTMRVAFAKVGFTMGEREHPKWMGGSQLYLARLWWPVGKRTHWVILEEDGTVLDPTFGRNPDWEKGTRVTSLYPLDPILPMD